MSVYCLNPECKEPKNTNKVRVCQTCGTNLVLNERYVAIKRIGRGGFGVTFLAVDIANNNSYCVIKQLLTIGQDKDTARTALSLFEREAKTLKKIDHPQIPKLLEYFEDNSQFYLIQEFILGKDLEKEVIEKGVFTESSAKVFLKGMLPVLQYIHSEKVIHRDIKPGNILRKKETGDLVLIDFGAVKDQVNTQLAKNEKQNTAISVGTMGFAPPEQLAMRPVYASDIYALAATCVYLLTGKGPKDLTDNNTGELTWEKYTTVTANFAKVLNKMLELDLRKRYQSAEEVLDAFNIIPYEQELAGSMTTMRTSSEDSGNISQPESNSTTGVTTSQNLAEAIRIRREQKKNKPQQPVVTNITKPKPTPPKPKVQLTAEQVLNEYSQGNRNFSEHNLNQLNLSSAKLAGAKFIKSTLIGINLQSSDLHKANFYNTNLAQANLKNTDLQNAEFVRANLKNTDLQNANLRQANLTNAILKEANLRGANLTGAKVEDEQLKEAKTSWSTIYPNGKRRWW